MVTLAVATQDLNTVVYASLLFWQNKYNHQNLVDSYFFRAEKTDKAPVSK